MLHDDDNLNKDALLLDANTLNSPLNPNPRNPSIVMGIDDPGHRARAVKKLRNAFGLVPVPTV